MEGSQGTRQGGGWLTFAAVMIAIAGTFNVIWGIAALANDDYFVADELLFGDLSMWGWFYLILGAIQLLVSYGIATGSSAAALAGILFAGLSAVNALVSVGAYPIWSIIIMVVNGLIIYGLAVYGTEESA
jgi:hypothetical protein